jgi:hypothetical protein
MEATPKDDKKKKINVTYKLVKTIEVEKIDGLWLGVNEIRIIRHFAPNKL